MAKQSLTNRTLLEIIVCATDERFADRLERHINEYNTPKTYRHILRDPGFKLILENEYFREALLAFLRADAHAYSVACRLNGRLWKSSREQERLALVAELERLTSIRDSCFEKYELMRRLVAWGDGFLNRPKTEWKSK